MKKSGKKLGQIVGRLMMIVLSAMVLMLLKYVENRS